MPRNSSGTYTLPAGNPVVSGTLIEASWANTTLSDLASAMTNSLSRGGEGGMTAALRLYDGTVSLPGLAFTSETSTGLYRAGSGDMRLAVTGSQVMQFLSTGVAVTGTLSASGNATLSGTLAVTGASTFSGQTNTFENSTAYYPQLINRNKTNDANGSYISLQKIRSTSVVQNGDVLGNLIFAGYDGAAYLQGAFINAVVSATPGTNDMPADLVFGTTSDGGAGPTERLRISNTGAGTASADWTFYGVRVGRGAGAVSTNTAVGASALAVNSTGARLTAVGSNAMAAVTGATDSVAFGTNALALTTTGSYNSAFGREALGQNTTGAQNTAIGEYVLGNSTTASDNTGVGYRALQTNTTGASNTAIGRQALYSNTTASNNTAVGYQAGYTNITGQFNVFVGKLAGYYSTGGLNTCVGEEAGYYTTGTNNTYLGYGAGPQNAGSTGSYNTFLGNLSGYLVTTGSKNSILGAYSGNQGGLDIRTASNKVVLSDGDGNPVFVYGGYPTSSTTYGLSGYATLGLGGTGSTGTGGFFLNGEATSGYGPIIAGYANGAGQWYAGSNSWIKGGTAYSTYTIAAGGASGGVALTAGATSWASASDERLKDIIEPISDAVTKVSSLRAVIGKYKSDATEKRRAFLIAQDVQAVLPEAVSEGRDSKDDETDYLHLAYTEVIPLLVAAIKELKAEFDAYKEAHP